jgi:hypothetical protein
VALGRPKNAQQRQKPGPPQNAEEPDSELDSYLAAITPAGEVETTGTGRGFGNAQVYQLRLPLMANERLKELAAKNGTSPASLVRDWVLQRLEQIDQSETQQPAWPQQDSRSGQITPPESPNEITIPQRGFR